MYSIQSSEDKMNEMQGQEYLQVEDLVTNFYTSRGIVKALDKISFSIRKGEIFGMVGESGCGKSVTALSVMDLVPDPPGRIVSGNVKVGGFNLLSDITKIARIRVLSETSVKIRRNKRAYKRHNFVLSKIRGRRIGMIFQEPSLALNPVLNVGVQITENILLHNRVSIADSLINRANLDTANVRKLIEDVKSDTSSSRSVINAWCKNNALPEIEQGIVSVFENYTGDAEIEGEIIALVKGNLIFVDLPALRKARDYYKYLDKLVNLELQIFDSEAQEDHDTVRRLAEERAQLRISEGKNYTVYKILRKLTGRRVEKVFKQEARRRAGEMLTLVNLPDPERIMDSYPHELSGGMQQRVMIAIALASDPMLLIADEPTTALDVTTQAQILNLIRNLNKVVGASVLFITHDLAVISEMCSRVAVMYAGNIVEEASVLDIFNQPKHPYTVGLLSAIPKHQKKTENLVKLDTIQGSVPNLITPPTGCRFHTRCRFAMDTCSVSKPALVEIGEGHRVACFLYSEEVAN